MGRSMIKQKRTRMQTLAALAAAALAAPVALAPLEPATATNLATQPSEALTADAVLVRTAVYDPVRNKFVKRKTLKPRFIPPNPCRQKKTQRRC
jgi:hypothetical protein